MANKFYDLYVTMFGKGDSEDLVHMKIDAVQAVARKYTTEFSSDPLPITDPALDQEIEAQYGLTIALNNSERQALVDLLVNDHSLQNLKPWGTTEPGQARVMIW